jgi:hypothetical protein
MGAVTTFTREAQHLLRHPGMFDWSTVTLLALVVYVYSVEVERANWDAVLAGIAFWLMDWANEIVNASSCCSTPTGSFTGTTGGGTSDRSR